MKKKYPVVLSKTEREECQRLIAAGTAPARKLTHARLLLKADQSSEEGPGWVDEAVADAVEVSQPTVVARVRKQYVQEGLEAALDRRAPNREYRRESWTGSRRPGSGRARLQRTASGAGPRRSLRLLADRLVEHRRSWRGSPTRR